MGSLNYLGFLVVWTAGLVHTIMRFLLVLILVTKYNTKRGSSQMAWNKVTFSARDGFPKAFKIKQEKDNSNLVCVKEWNIKRTFKDLLKSNPLN